MMRTWICFAVLVTGLYAAEKPAAQKAPAKANRAEKPAAVTVPKGAVETVKGTWHYTDPEGRKWIYRQTPWGMSRFEDKARATEETSADRAELDTMTAHDDGEYVRFEKRGPFGTYKWRRKKAELDTIEQRAWDRTQASAPRAKDEAKRP